MAEVSESEWGLYSPSGERKYVNQPERQRFLRVMESRAERDWALYSFMVACTGARVTEVLDLRALSFQVERNIVAFRTLKRRKLHFREVPVPPFFMQALDQHFGLRERQRDPDRARQRLWHSTRCTAWRFIKDGMVEAGVCGRPACPRGLRHGFGVGTLQANVPLNKVQQWMGHARPSTTAIYANAVGDEEIAFAARFWAMNGWHHE